MIFSIPDEKKIKRVIRSIDDPIPLQTTVNSEIGRKPHRTLSKQSDNFFIHSIVYLNLRIAKICK